MWNYPCILFPVKNICPVENWGIFFLFHQVLAHLLDMVFYSDEKERVIPLLVNIMHYVVPYLRNHRLEDDFHFNSRFYKCFCQWLSLNCYRNIDVVAASACRVWWNDSEMSSVCSIHWNPKCLFPCSSWQRSQCSQLPRLHPALEQPQRVPVHPACLEEGGFWPLHGPHFLPDGFLVRQPVSRTGMKIPVFISSGLVVEM